ncbi:MAG TPA: FkbM family methyltransferase [Rhizomicrobium sp.]
MNLRAVRMAIFDSTPKGQEFALKSRGEERFLCLAGDKAVSRSVFVDDIVDVGKVKKAIGLLGDSFNLKTLVDVGANIGTICIPAVRRGLAQNAIAIEPEPKNFRTLMANIYLNDVVDKIVCHNLAVGRKDDETLRFDLSPVNSGDHRVRSETALNFYFESDRKSILVKSVRLDSVIDLIDPATWLIWMDTQGYEGFVLQGAPNILAAKAPIVLELWPYGLTSSGSYPALKESLLQYDRFFDLLEDRPKPVPMSEANLDALHARHARENTWTDILVV